MHTPTRHWGLHVLVLLRTRTCKPKPGSRSMLFGKKISLNYIDYDWFGNLAGVCMSWFSGEPGHANPNSQLGYCMS